MEYKKIRAKSFAECVMKLRSIYGNEAIILGNREIEDRGLLGSGLFSRKSHELEYMLPEKKGRAALFPGQALAKTQKGEKNMGQEMQLSGAKSPAPMTGKAGLQKPELESPLSPSQSFLSTQPLFSEAHLRSLPGHGYSPILSNVQASIQAHELSKNGSYVAEIQCRLQAKQLSPAFVRAFMSQLESQLSVLDKQNKELVIEKSLLTLAKLIPASPAQNPAKGQSLILMLMGPGGVGKSTSIAKLAAYFHLQKKRSVSIYSLDDYRLGATEQLKGYTEVMDFPFHAPLGDKELLEALRREGAEIILMDCSGISHTNKQGLLELKDCVDRLKAESRQSLSLSLERHLVLAATIQPLLLERILKAYEMPGFDRLMITKLDETEFIGPFIEIADTFKRPFSFLMNGQELSAHLRLAQAEEMAAMLLEGEEAFS